MAKLRCKTTQLCISPPASPEQISSKDAPCSLRSKSKLKLSNTPLVQLDLGQPVQVIIPTLLPSLKRKKVVLRESMGAMIILGRLRDNKEDSESSDIDDSVVQFVREREVDPIVQQQLIVVIRNTWAIPGSREIFEKGIVSKSSGIGRRSIITERSVVEADL
ncbi:hypothetical protein KY289_024357 [Solanum tuberosum]|nr:hypothetical protein KY289_024357 [Solanum tuberosum]